jgi:hypothetical protein
MELFLTIVITLAILIVAVKFGDVIIALNVVIFCGIVLLVLTGFVALVVWTLLTGPSR